MYLHVRAISFSCLVIMANRTVKDAQTIKGTNPQYLVEKIIRTRIYDCKYWKEECFALTSELLVDKAMELRYIGGTFAGNIKPTPFLCLVLKMLQIQPQKDIIVEFIKNEEFKYVRALGAFYMRLTGNSIECYKYLEPLLNDYRKIRMQGRDGKFVLSHMDEFIDHLLRDDRYCDVILPRIQKRDVLEETNDIEPRVSVLEDDLDGVADSDTDDDDEEEEGEMREKERKSRDRRERDKERRRERDRSRSRSRSRSRDRRRHRSRSKSRDRDRRRSRSGDRDRDRRRDRRDRSRSRDRGSSRRHKDKGRDKKSSREEEGKSGGGGKDALSIEETNKLRASLGLAPLK